MSWVKTREKIGAVAALIFMALIGAFIAAAYGIQIPFLTRFMRAILGW